MTRAACIPLAFIFALLTSFAVAAPYGLTKADLETVKQLADLAISNNSSVATARRELEAQQQVEGFGNKVIAATSVTLNGSTGNLTQLPDGQVNPSFGVSISVNLASLVKTEPSKVEELTKRVSDAENTVRQTVLNAYVAWWSAGFAALAAAETVDFATATFNSVAARVKAGTATATDLISARERVTAAVNRLRDLNAAVITTRSDLARICGISNERLGRILTGAE